MTIPKVVFRYAYPFDQERRSLFLKKELGSYPEIEIVRNKADEWQILWDSYNTNDKIIRRIIELCGNSYPKDIEVYVFGDGMNPMSLPFLIPIMRKRGVQRTDDELIEVTIHELAHNFMSVPENSETISRLKSIYQQESISTQNHIIVYAIVQIILNEIFDGEKMRILVDAKDNPDYQKAIDIVNQAGPETILKEFRDTKLR